MKVLYVYDEMPKSYQTYMANTLTGLKKVIDVTAFAFKPNPKADAYPQNSIIQKLKRKIISRGEYEALARQWATNYNIIHLQHSYLFGKFPFFSIQSKSKIINEQISLLPFVEVIRM